MPNCRWVIVPAELGHDAEYCNKPVCWVMRDDGEGNKTRKYNAFCVKHQTKVEALEREQLRNSVRYPHTYACDLIRRSVSPIPEIVNDVTIQTSRLSRSDASCIKELFAQILNLSKEEVAIKLAEKYITEALDKSKK